MFLKYFARVKFYTVRSTVYYQMIQYVLIIVLFLRPYNLNFWIELALIFFIACLAILIGWFDRKSKILEREQSIANAENKELREIRDLALEIRDLLSELKWKK